MKKIIIVTICIILMIITALTLVLINKNNNSNRINNINAQEKNVTNKLPEDEKNGEKEVVKTTPAPTPTQEPIDEKYENLTTLEKQLVDSVYNGEMYVENGIVERDVGRLLIDLDGDKKRELIKFGNSQNGERALNIYFALSSDVRQATINNNHLFNIGKIYQTTNGFYISDYRIGENDEMTTRLFKIAVSEDGYTMEEVLREYHLYNEDSNERSDFFYVDANNVYEYEYYEKIIKMSNDIKVTSTIGSADLINGLWGAVVENDFTNLQEKPILYFVNNSLVGIYEKGIWVFPKDVELETIFGNEYYTVYTQDKVRAKAKQLRLSLGEGGYGSFRYEGSDATSVEGVMIDNNLGKFGTLKEYGYYFDLPNKLNEKLNKAKTIQLADSEATSVTAIAEGYSYEGENATKNLLAFNADYDVSFIKETEKNTVPEDVKKFIEDQLVANGVEKTIPYTLVQYFREDLNNDDAGEEIFYVLSNDSYLLSIATLDDYNEKSEEAEKLFKENGGFCMLISRIGGKVETIYSSFVSKEDATSGDFSMLGLTESLRNLNVVDLNNDKKYEIIFEVSGYEYWNDYLAIFADGKYITK